MELPRVPTEQLRQTPHGKVAYAFARALVDGDFAGAHAMLAPVLAASITADALASSYQRMVAYFATPPTEVEIETTLEAWPTKEPQDLGWAYASIHGDTAGEAVTVVVTPEGIREIAWGAPRTLSTR